MKTKITYEDLIVMNPCYQPDEIGITKGFSMTIPEFIDTYRNKVKSKEDIIWVLCRNDYMTDKDLRLFAVWCARESLKLVDNPDERSIGEATGIGLAAAWDAARAAARAAAWDAAWDAARAAAWDAARAAARDAARAAAWDAARAAARDAAWDAARAAAWAAAWDAARAAQIDKLKTYFI